MKTFVLTISGILLCAGLLFAQQNRPFPRTDLNAVPGTGQSEVTLRSVNFPNGNPNPHWYRVTIDGVVVAIVEPGIPEKIIIQNGFNKLLVEPGTVNLNRGRFNPVPHAATIYGKEIVIEAASNSITMEISRGLDNKGRPFATPNTAAEITETRPLGTARPPVQVATPVQPTPPTIPQALSNLGVAGIEGALARASEQVFRNVPL